MSRKFNVYCFRVDPYTGADLKKYLPQKLNATPMTHDKACIFISKHTVYKWRSIRAVLTNIAP